jgi:integrase
VRVDTKTREQAPIQIGEQIPSKADVRAILAASTDPWHPLFLTAAFTGMRASELRGLIWKNVDLDGYVIHIRQRADEKNKIGPCKSKSAYRAIQIPDVVADELRRWRSVYPLGPLEEAIEQLEADVPNYAGALYCAEKATGAARSDIEWAHSKNVCGVVLSHLARSMREQNT